jgi:hypothetical protein
VRVKLKGSKGTTLELSRTTWEAALQAASAEGWRWNRNGGNVISKADANLLSRVLRSTAGDLSPYLIEFLRDNSITVD